MRAALARPGTTALALVAGAVLVVVGLLVGVSLAGSARAAAPAEDSVDAGFARDMQVHHGQAVEMAVLVRDRAEDPDLRQIALDIVLTQQNQQGRMAGWLQTWGLGQNSSEPVMAWMGGPFGEGGHDGMAGMDSTASTASTDGTADAATGNPMVAMGMATPGQMTALREADGVEAERIFLQLMIDHHVGGVAMAEVAAEQAAQPYVRDLARSMVEAQSSEITVLQDLLDDRGGPVDLPAA